MNRKKHLHKQASLATAKRVWGPWATAGFGIATAGGMAIALILFVMAPRYFNIISNRDYYNTYEGIIISAGAIFCEIIGVCLILVFIRLRKGLSISEYLGLRRISLKTVLVSLGVLIGLSLILDVLENALGVPTSRNEQFYSELYNNVWPPLFWIGIVIIGPVFEEVLFRGFLFEGFRHSRLGVVGTIILTSMVWSLLHLPDNLFTIGGIFILGLALGFMRFRSNSLWSPLFMHSCQNLIATILMTLNIR
jgi:uncharacterized protein